MKGPVRKHFSFKIVNICIRTKRKKAKVAIHAQALASAALGACRLRAWNSTKSMSSMLLYMATAPRKTPVGVDRWGSAIKFIDAMMKYSPEFDRPTTQARPPNSQIPTPPTALLRCSDVGDKRTGGHGRLDAAEDDGAADEDEHEEDHRPDGREPRGLSGGGRVGLVQARGHHEGGDDVRHGDHHRRVPGDLHRPALVLAEGGEAHGCYGWFGLVGLVWLCVCGVVGDDDVGQGQGLGWQLTP